MGGVSGVPLVLLSGTYEYESTSRLRLIMSILWMPAMVGAIQDVLLCDWWKWQLFQATPCRRIDVNVIF